MPIRIAQSPGRLVSRRAASPRATWFYVRHNADGVVEVDTGAPARVPDALMRTIASGVVMCCLAATSGLWLAPFYLLMAACIVGAAAILLVALTVVRLWMRLRLRGLVSGASVSRTLAIRDDRVGATAERAGARARLVVNGTPYYRLVDFGDPGTLLRPANTGDGRDLLRPAGEAHGAVREALLRAALPAADDLREV